LLHCGFPSDSLILQKYYKLLCTSHSVLVTINAILQSFSFGIELISIGLQSGDLVFDFLDLGEFGIQCGPSILGLLGHDGKLLFLWHDLLVDDLIVGKSLDPLAKITSWLGLVENVGEVEVLLGKILVSDLLENSFGHIRDIESLQFLQELL
jgi:hypothetical protein